MSNKHGKGSLCEYNQNKLKYNNEKLQYPLRVNLECIRASNMPLFGPTNTGKRGLYEKNQNKLKFTKCNYQLQILFSTNWWLFFQSTINISTDVTKLGPTLINLAKNSPVQL